VAKERVGGLDRQFKENREGARVTVIVTERQREAVRAVVAKYNKKNSGRMTVSSWALNLVLAELEKEGYPREKW
jgi:hypothetical protein